VGNHTILTTISACLFQLEKFVAAMLAAAGISLATSAWALHSMPKYAMHIVALSFFVFEV
jgi:hypothetical protein